MRKIVLGLLLLFSVATKLSAQIDDTTVVIKYWYYPAQNIYYDEASGDYWYYDVPTVKWIEVKQLPSTYTLAGTDTRYRISYKGQNVWMDNKKHRIKYKVKKDGRVKVKPKN